MPQFVPPPDGPLPDYRFALEEQKAREEEGGTAREASAVEFPASQGVAGVSMRLRPGALRELHWHANAAEWGYVLAGRCRTTLIHPDSTWAATDHDTGDTWYFPRGYGHMIQTLGDEECHFILAFDNGYFSENATFSVTDWIAQTPREIVATSLGIPEEDLAGLPDHEAYMAVGPIPPDPLPAPPGAERPEAQTHRYPLLEAEPRSFDGGTLRVASSAEFPISRTMTAAFMELDPGAVREMHWHPNADEWQYLISGAARMTVFASLGKASTVELRPGDVGYAPMGYGHYIENTSDEPMRMLLAFNSGIYEEIGLSSWLAGNPRQVVATNLNLTDTAESELPTDDTFIARPPKRN
jgi:oxalate decarboxylase